MGSSSSKVARGAASGARKFPTRAPGAAAVEAGIRRKPHPPTSTSSSPTQSDDALKTSSSSTNPQDDPSFSSASFTRRLHEMGIVQPNPTFSPSSTASPNLSPESAIAPLGPLFPSAKHNATLSVLEAQRQVEAEADRDLRGMGRGLGRRFLDVGKLAEAVEARGRGVPDGEVERAMGMKGGVLGRLGAPGALTCVA